MKNNIEDAIRLVSLKFTAGGDFKKPVLFHAIRVGTSLHFKGNGPDVVIAGYLHDLIEDTDMTEQGIAVLFGKEIAGIVAANTKNSVLKDSDVRRAELIKRCIAHSEKAAIVKAADILDNYSYYQDIGDAKGIGNCKNNAALFMENFNSAYTDPIFSELFSTVL